METPSENPENQPKPVRGLSPTQKREVFKFLIDELQKACAKSLEQNTPQEVADYLKDRIARLNEQLANLEAGA